MHANARDAIRFAIKSMIGIIADAIVVEFYAMNNTIGTVVNALYAVTNVTIFRRILNMFQENTGLIMT